ncbi:MAG: DUF542 domain-containing protein, partial [Ilumatobacteraceae bacterium]
MTLGDLVTAHPELAPVLDHRHVDYCSMGQRTLEMVCSDRGLDPASFLDELTGRAADAPLPAWASMNVVDLCAHILEVHHVPLWTELARLDESLQDLDSVHGRYVPWLGDAVCCFASLRSETERHLRYEEQILFPAIGELFTSGHLPHVHCRTLAGQFSATRREHDHLFQLFDLLRRVVRNARGLAGEESRLADAARAVA